MKLFLIAAVTLDGYIARTPNQSSLTWTSKADKTRFVELTKRAGVVIMGSTTYATIGKPLKDRRMIIYHHEPITIEGVEVTQLAPKELLAKLEKEGYKEVALCGGSQIYTLFAEAGVIDTMYLTVEPIVFGSGIKLFAREVLLRLKLVKEEKVENTLLLDYEVEKHVNHN